MKEICNKILIFTIFISLIFYTNDTIAKSKKKIENQEAEISVIKKTAGFTVQDAMKIHNIGKVWTAASNYGVYGDPEVPDRFPSYEWPGGSGTHYLWEGRLWIGAIVGGDKYVSHADYGNYELHPSQEERWQPSIYPAPNDFLMGWSGSNPVAGKMKSLRDSYVIFDDLNSNSFPLGVQIYQRTLSWSVKDYDDLVVYEISVVNIPGEGPGALNDVFISWNFDADVGTGTDPTSANIDDLVEFDGYDGADGNTDERDWVENFDWNDNGDIDGYDEYGILYGLQYHASPDIENPNYDPSKNKPDGFFDEYTVIVDSKGPELIWQNSTVIEGPGGSQINAVAGKPVTINDEVIHGYCVPRNTSIIYDGDDPTTPEYDAGERQAVSKALGYIGGRLLYSPKMDENPIENIPVESLILPYSHMWWNWNSDPGSDIQKYDFMAATHADAKGKYFMPHPFDMGAPEFDYRFLLTVGIFDNFEEGDTLNFVFATGVGLGLKGVRQNLDNAMVAYYSGSIEGNPYNPTAFNKDIHWRVPVPPPVPGLVYNPIDQGANLAWDNKAELTIDDMLGYVDFAGYKVYRAKYSTQDWQLIYACDNVEGEVKVIDHASGDSIAYTDLDAICHTFVDSGGTFLGEIYEKPVNGLPYYYIVTAYDPDKPEKGLVSIESARSNFMTDPESGASVPVTPQKLYKASENPKLSDLDVKVVPNPYKGACLLEKRYENKIMFNNLPKTCKISILSVSGDLIKIIEHTDGSSTEFWDLVSRNNQDVVSGLYLYIVETDDGKSTGKFVIIR
ncbi:MAG: T9SS type A sorting domain-containing protein [Bacteroidetes bacterium]|nr:T9SS type A sorting domain-containing protein [Bacteroidota bacterium]